MNQQTGNAAVIHLTRKDRTQWAFYGTDSQLMRSEQEKENRLRWRQFVAQRPESTETKDSCTKWVMEEIYAKGTIGTRSELGEGGGREIKKEEALIAWSNYL